MEQRDFDSGQWIHSVGLRSFEAVTPGARQPEIGFIRYATAGQRNNVFDVHLPTANLWAVKQ